MRMSEIPDACDIEIVETKRNDNQPWPPTYGVIIPNDIRINGRSVLAPDNEPIIVHEIATRPGEPVRVTLTLYARRVTIGAEVQDYQGGDA